jgi:hypothetical protein
MMTGAGAGWGEGALRSRDLERSALSLAISRRAPVLV